jgi:hypothetical protein
VYKRALGLPSSTSNLLVHFETSRYPMQIGWLVRTVKYWNKRVAELTMEHNKSIATYMPDQPDLLLGCQQLLGSYSTLSQVFYSNVQFGLKKGVDCWSKQLHDALYFIMPEGANGTLRLAEPYAVLLVN